MAPKLIDAHTHVNFKAFKDDADEVIRRALDAGTWIINVGAARDTSERAVEIANRYGEGVYAIAGLHPVHCSEEFDYEFYKALAQDAKVVGIGECGLDYFRNGKQTKDEQIKIFEQHIKLARELDKPLMLHVREAYDDVLDVIVSSDYTLMANPGNVHFFAGTREQAKKFLDLGFTLSFTGVITFTHDYDEVVKKTPLKNILIETDAPFVPPVPHRGERNEPLYVEYVARRISEIKSEPYEKVMEATTKNTMRVFGL